MSQPLLFDATADAVHAVLPDMGLACGRDLVAVVDDPARTLGASVLTYGAAGTTCPECLAEPISALIRWMQTDHKTRGPRPVSTVAA